MLCSTSYSCLTSNCPRFKPRRAAVPPAPLRHGMRSRRLTVAAARPTPQQPSIQEGLRATPTHPRTTGPGMSNVLPFRRTSPQLQGPLHRPVAAPQHAFELDSQGVERLKLEPDGWNSWEWRGHKINWVVAGDHGPPVLLVHGYGASIYHWRYNIPQLAKHCRVFAIDCLGFGWSDKPLTDYSGIWAEQIADFVHHVVGEAAVLVGNSLGGYSVIHAAAMRPQVAKGVVLLNAAGGFERSRQAAATGATAASSDGNSSGSSGIILPAPSSTAAAAALPSAAAASRWARAFMWARDGLLRGLVRLYYNYMKRQSSIKRALEQLYVHKHHVDEDLVRSVAIPAADPAAEEVVFLLLRAALSSVPLNALLDSVAAHRTPLLLLWGSKDPWTVREIPRRICDHYPAARLSLLPAGHCPQDDTPHLVNSELLAWIRELD